MAAGLSGEKNRLTGSEAGFDDAQRQTRDLRAGTASSMFPAVSLTLGLAQSVLEKCQFGE